MLTKAIFRKAQLCVVFSLYGVVSLQAQGMGYQGKKLTASGYLGVNPSSLYYESRNATNYQGKLIGLNYGLQTDYALFDNMSLGFEWNTYAVDVAPGYNHRLIDEDKKINGDYSIFNESFSVKEWGLGAKFFFHKSAPLGSYMSIRYGGESVRAANEVIKQYLVDDYSSNWWDESPEIVERNMEEPIKRNGLVTIDFGVNRIIADKILFHYGVSSRFVLKKRAEDSLESAIYNRLRIHRMFRFEIGVGYLLW